MNNNKKILVFGGTSFVGRAIVKQLLAEGYGNITLFNRGKTNADLYPMLPLIRGNREVAEDIALLGKNDSWDAVIDVSGYFPLSLAQICEVLRGRVGRYIFISTASVYDLSQPIDNGIDEDFPLEVCGESEMIDTTMSTYGKRKVACEAVLRTHFPDSCIILRPAVIYGPYDPFDRHYYWLYRVAKSSKIALPAETESRSRLNSTYVTDLARVTTAAINASAYRRIYNATTHPPLSLVEMVQSMAAAANTDPVFATISLDILTQKNIQPWVDLPLWTNADLLAMTNDRLLADFLPTPTPIIESWRESMAYYNQLGWPLPKAGISLEHEQTLWGK